jgi:DNA-binding HxlR family transcriptional regulator
MKTGYGQFCPVAVASEIFAERWTPIILRELVLGSRKFNDIHRACRACRAHCSRSGCAS